MTNRIRRGTLTPSALSNIWDLSIETKRSYSDLLAILVGGILPSAVTPQLRYHYSDLAETIVSRERWGKK